MSTWGIDQFFLPCVSFTLDGETVPARELCWVMYASCGCAAGMHMMTTDTINEAAAWKVMSGNAAMQKQDRARGFTIRMMKHRDVPFDDCTHSPKWGYVPTPIPPEHSWAATQAGRVQHLVPLVVDNSDEAKRERRDWTEGDGEKWWLQKVTSLCGKASETSRLWSHQRWQTDGKPECTHCVNIAVKQALPLNIGGAA